MSLNLLVADDSTTIHKVVGLAFEGEDVTVLTAGNGQEALDKANEVQPDIIFADTEMPELNGFELCQKIKENEKLKSIPVCLIHSDFEEFDEEKYRACRADSHLPKPFKSEDIVNKVAEITGGTGKEIKDELILNDDLSGKEDTESIEKPHEDLDELEILPLDEVIEEIQDNETIELKLENALDEPTEDKKASTEDTSEDKPLDDEIAGFVEDIKTDNDSEKELDEFNEALNMPDEELGEAEPYIVVEEDKPEISKKPESENELKITLPVQEEKEKLVETEEMQVPVEEKTPEETSELELSEEEIKEEKEDLIEDTGILPHEEKVESPEIEKPALDMPPKETKQIAGDDFERLIGGYIKQVIEKILKEAVQSEISTITDKIIEAVERIAHEITPDISRTIIQKEIEKIKNPED